MFQRGSKRGAPGASSHAKQAQFIAAYYVLWARAKLFHDPFYYATVKQHFGVHRDTVKAWVKESENEVLVPPDADPALIAELLTAMTDAGRNYKQDIGARLTEAKLRKSRKPA